MEGNGDKQLEFEQMKVAIRGGPEGQKAVEEAEIRKLISACEEAGVQPPNEKEIEVILKNGDRHKIDKPKLDHERAWELRKEEIEDKLWPNGLPNGNK